MKGKKLQWYRGSAERCASILFSHGKGSFDNVNDIGDIVHEHQNTSEAELLQLPKEAVVSSPIHEFSEVASCTSCFVTLSDSLLRI